MLRKNLTQHVRSSVQAAYAEANDQQLAAKVEQAVSLMQNPFSRFYRIENESGAYVGYFIMGGDTVLQQYVRPHFMLPEQELSALYAEAQDPRFYASLGANNFINLNA